MVYRIDFPNFMVHMIDHFTREEIIHMEYAIISASISNGGHSMNIGKCNDLYPDPDVVATYAETHDKELMKRMYMDQLDPKDEISKCNMEVTIYRVFLNLLELHHDVCIICGRSENDFIDVLCEHLKNKFAVEVIDLNQLFTTGRVGSIYIDRDEIHDKCVDIRRYAELQHHQSLNSTREGRATLLTMMSKKQKLKKLDELGITPTSTKSSDLNELLIDSYVNDEDGD